MPFVTTSFALIFTALAGTSDCGSCVKPTLPAGSLSTARITMDSSPLQDMKAVAPTGNGWSEIVLAPLDTANFPARWTCGTWSPSLGWLHIVSDITIFIAYLAIPLALFYFIRAQKSFPFRLVFLLFCGFILSCGIGHLLEACIFWWPVYRLAGLWKLVTAVVSVATVAVLFPMIPKALRLKSPEQLEREVQKRTAELSEVTNELVHANETLALAQSQAEAATVAKSQFLTTISHELRTPLTAILGFAEELEQEERSPQTRESVQLILKNGKHLLQIINDVLDLSKADADKIELQLAPTATMSVMKVIEDLFDHHARKQGIALRIERASGVPDRLLLDDTRVRQVLINIVGNAIKFTETGSVTVRESFESIEACSGIWRISVSDTGIGIPADQLGVIFDPFRQAEASTTRRYGGTGLGLSICKRLIDLMRGTIDVRSEVGVGTEFTISVPVKVCSAGLPPIPRKVENKIMTTTLNGMRVLVVDDVVDNLLLLERILTKAGAQVRTCSDGSSALQDVQQALERNQPFDLILMDIQMPVMDGHEAVAELRRRGISTPVLMLSAHATEEMERTSREVGANGYLPKPIQRASLLESCGRWAAARGANPALSSS